MANLAGKNFKILERKSSKFGAVGYTDIGNELQKQWSLRSINYYDNVRREDIYTSCLDRYQHDQLARPIVNLIVNAIFNEKPDFQGDDTIIKRVNDIIKASEINWSSWGADLEVFGDVFIRAFLGEDIPKIVSIPASSIVVVYSETNVLDIKRYAQFFNGSLPILKSDEELPEYAKAIPADEVCHIKINNTSNMIYGSSTLRPILWWLDVLDNLWERNTIRAIQYYGAPIIVITGVPAEHQATLKTSMESEGQRPGRSIILPPECKVDVPDFTKNYPIQEFIDRVYQYILSACNIPQHLVYESDSSRGVAMFSGDSFDMMIKNRRRIWELGLVKILKYILMEEGLWQDESKLKIGWKPVFQRDLKDMATLIQTALETGLYSKRTAREVLGVDHSEELERVKKQKTEEPDEITKPPEVSPKVAPTTKASSNQ